ncbi:hypothetical protein DY023_04000 [Microbacterium bovistercoris]|uniref:Uncharacterized protein n=1 Tax=Microbacterium bovistercoris TaxID=2293570 RepID=A0A371NWE9_9MICO|nr:hypothetical protein [Microbacterium bovistercoris]REJ07369.1 hypothetical protein DY023_04000 [Microbacterium bovistercoris]
MNIALTGKAELARDEVHERFPFKEKQQIVRLGLSYAMRLKLEPIRGAGFGRAGDGQNMNVGSFDPSGELLDLVRAFYPDAEDPAEVAETLMSLGLVQLAADLRNSTVTRITDILYAGDGD